MKRPIRLVLLAAAALAASTALLRLAGAAGVLDMTAGAFDMSNLWPNAGGGTLSEGGVSVTGVVGAPSQSMSGGGFSLTPGIVGSQSAAQPTAQDAHAYPTPFKPSLGETAITFAELPPQCTIEVYTIDGQRVQTFHKNDSLGTLAWSPVVNSLGQAVASGVYFFVVSQPGQPIKRGKLMIIK